MHSNAAIILVYLDWIPQKILKKLISDYNSLVQEEGASKYIGERLFECIAPIWIRHIRITSVNNFLKFTGFSNKLSREALKGLVEKKKCTCINIGYNLYFEYEKDHMNTIQQIIRNFSGRINELKVVSTEFNLQFSAFCEFSSFVKSHHAKKSFLTLTLALNEFGKPVKVPWDKHLWIPEEISNILSNKSINLLEYPKISNIYSDDIEIPVLTHILVDEKTCPECGLENRIEEFFCSKCGYYFEEPTQINDSYSIKLVLEKEENIDEKSTEKNETKIKLSNEIIEKATEDPSLYRDIVEFHCEFLFDAPNNGISSIKVSPNGKILLSGSDVLLHLINLQALDFSRYGHHQKGIRSISFSKDGRYVLTACYNGIIKVWDFNSKKVLKSFDVGDSIIGKLKVAFSPDEKFIICGYYSSELKWGIIKIISSNDGYILRVIKTHKGDYKDIAISPDGKYAVSSGKKQVKIWDINTGELVDTLLENIQKDINVLSFSPDGSVIIGGDFESTIRIWDFNKKELLKRVKIQDDYINVMEFSKDGRYLITASDDKSVKIWDFENMQLLQKLNGFNSGISSLAISPKQNYLIAGGDYEDPRICVWRFKNFGWTTENLGQIKEKSFLTYRKKNIDFEFDENDNYELILLKITDFTKKFKDIMKNWEIPVKSNKEDIKLAEQIIKTKLRNLDKVWAIAISCSEFDKNYTFSLYLRVGSANINEPINSLGGYDLQITEESGVTDGNTWMSFFFPPEYKKWFVTLRKVIVNAPLNLKDWYINLYKKDLW